jgi:hypothetical protein
VAQKLSVQIALEGGKEVERQLASMGEEGQKAFQKISQSAELAGGFKNLKIADVTAQLKEMGITGVDSVNQIKQAVRTAGNFESLTAGTVGMENGFNKVAESSKRATAAFGLTRRELGALRTTFRQLDLGPIGNQIAALGRVGGAFGTAGIAIAGVGAVIAAGSVALVKFANAAEETYKSLRQLQNASGDSIENVSAMAIVFKAGGTPVKEFADAFADLSRQVRSAAKSMADDVEQSSQRIKAAHQAEVQATLSLESAELNLRKIQLARREERTGIDPRARANIARAERALQLEQAEAQVAAAKLAKQQAAHNAIVAEANDLEKIIDLYGQMAAGVKVAFDPLTSQATKNTALLATLAKAGDNWKFVLADILKTATEMERIQIGKTVGLSPDMIRTLSVGSQMLLLMAQRVKQLGLELNAVDQLNLERLIRSQNESASLFDAIKEKMGALVAPAIASFWEGFTNRLAQLVPVFTQIAASVGQMDFSGLGAAAADFLAVIARIASSWAAMFSGQVSIVQVLSQLFEQAWPVLLGLVTQLGSALGLGIIKGMYSATAGLPIELGKWIGSQIVQGITTSWQVLTGLAVKLGSSIGEGIISGIISAIKAAPGAIWEAIKSGLGQVGQFLGGGAGAPAAPGLAGGGLLGGRGTGTSDSNLAWLSRGEYITPARAVAQPGVLSFLEALRRSGGNLSRVLDGMGRFALGGMVRGPIPAFAAGGLAGGSNVTIQFPGLPAIGGLRASANVVDQLHKAAALAQVRSGGRKPSRYS